MFCPYRDATHATNCHIKCNSPKLLLAITLLQSLQAFLKHHTIVSKHVTADLSRQPEQRRQESAAVTAALLLARDARWSSKIVTLVRHCDD